MNPNPAVAKKLENRADELASMASSMFLESQQGEALGQHTRNLHDEWSHHFRQRVLELSAALAAGEERLFTSRITWSRRAMRARMKDHDPIKESLHSLRAAITAEFGAASLGDALACIDMAINDYGGQLPEEQVSQLDPGIPAQRLALLYLQSALEGNTRQAMEVVLEAIDAGMTHSEAITRVLLPAQSEVGHLWHIDHITIAEEHLVTTTTHRLMTVIADRAPRKPDRGKTAVSASIAGNVHDTGIRALAYLLEMDGWRSIYLGSDVPRNDLPAAVHFYDADIVLLSTALSSQLPRLQESIAAIRETCDDDVKIMVGGNAFWDAPDAWQKLGADGYTGDASMAVQMAAALGDTATRH